MLLYTLFRFKSRKIPTDLSNKLHPRIDTGAFSKHGFHLIYLYKFKFIELIIQQKRRIVK